MADPTQDANYQASEFLFNALYRGDKTGLRRAVLRMRAIHDGDPSAGVPALPWEQIRCELAPGRFSSAGEAELVNYIGEKLREYAMSDRPAL